jgi:hypothetical protein
MSVQINQTDPNTNETILVTSFQIVNFSRPSISNNCGSDLELTIRLLDSINAAIYPFTLMTTFTIITLIKIFMSRKNSASKSQKSNGASKSAKVKSKDLNFAMVSISMCLIYLVFYLPICIFQLIAVPFPISELTNVISQHLFYAIFGSLFFINMAVNKIFRREFYLMLHLKAPEEKSKTKQLTIHTNATVDTHKSKTWVK